MSPQITKSRRKSLGNLNQSSIGALSGVLLDEEYMLSNSEDEGDEGTGKPRMKTRRDKKSNSPMKLLDVGESYNSQHFQTMNLSGANLLQNKLNTSNLIADTQNENIKRILIKRHTASIQANHTITNQD